jgi:hypothetical protein
VSSIINKLLGSFTTDKNGQRLPLKNAVINLVIVGLVLLLSVWGISLLVVLNPLIFIAGAAAVGGAWYGSRFGFTLPWQITTQPPTEPTQPSARTVTHRPRTAASATPSKPQIGGGRR